MELIIFDLDRTLLNSRSEISPSTRETLQRLSARGISYTVASGRTLRAAMEILACHTFHLPRILMNGLMIWTPGNEEISHQNCLTLSEVQHALPAILAQRGERVAGSSNAR